MAAGDLLSRIEGISLSDYAKGKIQSVQEYSLLSVRSPRQSFSSGPSTGATC